MSHTPESGINWERYDAVLAHIEEHPEEWDQREPARPGASCGCFGHHVRRMFADCAMEAFDAIGECLDASMEERSWLYSYRRTLADFKAFRSAGGIPKGRT